VLRCLPLRALDGSSSSGLPVLAVCPRLIDFEVLADPEVNSKVEIFLKSHLEQRAIVLHNLSLQQERMVKFVELRDLAQLSIPRLLSRGHALMTVIKKLIGLIRDVYPEVVHQVVMINAPSSISLLLNVITPLLNERMKAKIKIVPIATTYVAVTERLSARAVLSWIQSVCVESDELILARGAEEYAARWLRVDEVLKLKLVVASKDVRLRCAFSSLEGAHSEIVDAQVTADTPHEYVFKALTEGVFWVCMSNATGWGERQVRLSLWDKRGSIIS